MSSQRLRAISIIQRYAISIIQRYVFRVGRIIVFFISGGVVLCTVFSTLSILDQLETGKMPFAPACSC